MVPQPTSLPTEKTLEIGYDRAIGRALAPGAGARVMARLRASALDRALARGADPLGSPQLAARANALTSRRGRSEIADSLDGLVFAAHGPRKRWWALAKRDIVLEQSSELHDLADVLRSRRPVYAQGVARLNQLLTDGTGPVYRGDGAELARELASARTALAH